MANIKVQIELKTTKQKDCILANRDFELIQKKSDLFSHLQQYKDPRNC